MTPDRRARILIVDDDEGVRRVVVRALQEEGYEVVAVNDGQAAFDAATSADAPYDLVVTNNHMPHMSGAELVARLREQYPRMPIVHLDDLSRSPQEEMPPDVPNLYKPFSIDRLAEQVARLLGQNPAS